MSAELRVVGFWQRLGVLFQKEVRQILRDKRLAISLVVPPVLQMLLFGYALNSNVTALRLGIQDDSKTPESRELIATLTESKSFLLQNDYFDGKSMDASISRGELDAGVVIPYDFARDINRKRPTNIQFILNAVDTNTAAIGQGYAEGVVASYNASLAAKRIRAQVRTVAVDATRKGSINLIPAFLFNPGLITTWFIVTGTLGTLLVLNGSMVASTAMIKEREAGTVEQLLMTPAGTAEIILAKLAPLFGLLTLVVFMAMGMIRFVFNVPMHGSFLLVFGGAAMCLLCGIGIGTFLATVAKSAQQVMLLIFFINPPLAALSGALAPVEAMPAWLRPMTLLNPIYHFGIITRSVMIKGGTFEDLWINFAALIAFTVVLMGFSVWRFRKQLG